MVDPLCGCFSYFSSRLRFYSLNNNIVKYNKWGFSFGQPENLYINLDQIERSVCNVDMVYNSPTGQEDQFSFDSFDWCRQIKDICVYKFKNHWLIKWNFKYEKSPSPNREIWRKKSAVQIPFFGRENFPDFKRLVPWTGSYELAARRLSKVKYTLLVGLKDWELFKGGNSQIMIELSENPWELMNSFVFFENPSTHTYEVVYRQSTFFPISAFQIWIVLS